MFGSHFFSRTTLSGVDFLTLSDSYRHGYRSSRYRFFFALSRMGNSSPPGFLKIAADFYLPMTNLIPIFRLSLDLVFTHIHLNIILNSQIHFNMESHFYFCLLCLPQTKFASGPPGNPNAEYRLPRPLCGACFPLRFIFCFPHGSPCPSNPFL